jgi:hypothetical protein
LLYQSRALNFVSLSKQKIEGQSIHAKTIIISFIITLRAGCCGAKLHVRHQDVEAT